MTAERGDVVIVGAGLAGAPYDRPALSKDVLTGARDGPALRLRTQGYWDERRIELRPGCAVDELDLEGRRVTADGDVVGFEHLVLATGLLERLLLAISEERGVDAVCRFGYAEHL